LLPLTVTASICTVLLGFSLSSVAATATNLVTICTSAATTIQASKCTAWQYNYYSPTVYIESYPQVSPGPTGYTDPKYEYRLGSTLTPANGVKVCPTALTPGVSFASTAADPCPNNKLVAASTVLPADSYSFANSPGGIVVYQVNTFGISEVTGSPFVESPVLTTYTGSTTITSPALMASDPSGTYLYALYNSGGYGVESVYTYQMVKGVLTQITSTIIADNIDTEGNVYEMFATAQHLYAANACGHDQPACVGVWSTKNGVLTYIGAAWAANVGYELSGTPINIAVDPQEQFLYWYYSSTNGTVADTVAIFSLTQFETTSGDYGNSLLFIQTLPVQGALIVGTN